MRLGLERLERRVCPVVFQTYDTIVSVPRGGFYDGVVRMDISVPGGVGYGTGGLIQTGKGQGFGHHVLTAAHAAETKRPL